MSDVIRLRSFTIVVHSFLFLLLSFQELLRLSPVLATTPEQDRLIVLQDFQQYINTIEKGGRDYLAIKIERLLSDIRSSTEILDQIRSDQVRPDQMRVGQDVSPRAFIASMTKGMFSK